MPARPFTRRQALQNAAFLRELRRTGNSRLAADLLGVHRSTYTKRRAKHAAFAKAWDAALAAADAAFKSGGGPHSSVLASAAKQSSARVGTRLDRQGAGAPRDDGSRLKTTGGEPVVTRLANGRLQLRRAPPGRMTEAAEQAFLAALSATANVRLSAAAAGFAHPSFHARRRASPDFAADFAECLAAARAALARALADEAARVEAGLSVPFEPFPPGWPEGMTIAQLLRARGMPPVRRPFWPISARVAAKGGTKKQHVR